MFQKCAVPLVLPVSGQAVLHNPAGAVGAGEGEDPTQHVAVRVYGQVQLWPLTGVESGVNVEMSITSVGSGGTGTTICNARSGCGSC